LLEKILVISTHSRRERGHKHARRMQIRLI